MHKNIYIINFFVTPHFNMDALHRYLADASEINGFWNYVPLVYCVKTSLTASELSARLSPFLYPNGEVQPGTAGFFVAELNPFNIDGKLPRVAWSWFYDQPFPPPAQGSGSLSLMDLLSPPKDQ